MLKKSHYVFYSCLSFILAIGLSSFYILPWLILYITGLLALIIMIFFKAKSFLNILAVGLLFFVMGCGYYIWSEPEINQAHIAFYNNQTEIKWGDRWIAEFEAMIIEEPDIRTDHVKYIVEADQLLDNHQRHEINGRVLIRTNLIPVYQYGDRLSVSCQLQQPEKIEDFAYDKYLALSRIYSLCYNGQIEKIGSNQGGYIKTQIFKLKNNMAEVVNKILPEPQSSFLGGLLWGAKKGMPVDILENFNRTGVTHIIAVSGYNITIIAVALSGLFISLGLSRQKAFWLIVVGIIFFVIITGAPASIIRAGLMGVLALLSQNLGRPSSMRIVLIVSAVVMLLINPLVLIWDAGFQLSFLATIGLIYFVPVIKPYTIWLPEKFQLRESFTTTMAAIIMTLPLILFQFGRLSILAPLANLLILPAIPLNMAIGFLALMCGFIWLPLGQLIGYIGWFSLTYVLKIAEWISQISWSSIEVPEMSWMIMVIGYVIISFLIYKQIKKNY